MYTLNVASFLNLTYLKGKPHHTTLSLLRFVGTHNTVNTKDNDQFSKDSCSTIPHHEFIIKVNINIVLMKTISKL